MFGEESLAVLREILIDSVTGNDGVEPCGAAICFGAKDSAEALGFFLARAKGSRDLDSD